MTEIRCVKCRRLLFKAKGAFHVETKCPKCGYLNRIGSEGCTLNGVSILIDEDMKANEWKIREY
jgi:LSD1 subclass zinc finger protein